jgi:hypothetical protein
MRKLNVLMAGCILMASVAAVQAARVEETRERAAYVLTGKVQAVYIACTPEHGSYIVEMKVDEVIKGANVKKGDTFRASIYQHKTRDGIWDTPGHKIVPKAGDKATIYVKDDHGRNEGIYPDWIDILEEAKK